MPEEPEVRFDLPVVPPDPPPVAAMAQLPWLPPVGLALAHLAQAISWGLLIGLWATGRPFDSLAAFAWPHVAGVAWLSVFSLSVLFHVIPGFMDVRIPAERFARGMLAPVWLGAMGLAAAFWLERPSWLPWTGGLTLIGLLGVTVPQAIGILRHEPESQEAARPAPLVPAFLLTLGSLVLAGILGVLMATVLAGGRLPAGPAVFAPSHAYLAAGGWLSLLVFGVSTRTLRRIFGAPVSRLHGLASGLFTVGVVVLGLTFLLPMPQAGRIGGALAAVGAILFACETGLRLRAARGSHLPLRAFVGASAAYLVVSVVLGLGTAGGLDWGAAYVFVAIGGWIGQMLNGHSLHIGIRFIATLARGDDDQTEPVDLLSGRLSWTAWSLLQGGVALGALGILADRTDLAALAGIMGLAGWTALSANALLAWKRACRT